MSHELDKEIYSISELLQTKAKAVLPPSSSSTLEEEKLAPRTSSQLIESNVRWPEKPLRALQHRPPHQPLLRSVGPPSLSRSKDHSRQRIRRNLKERLNTTESAHLRHPSVESGGSTYLAEEEGNEQAPASRRGTSLVYTGLEILRRKHQPSNRDASKESQTHMAKWNQSSVERSISNPKKPLVLTGRERHEEPGPQQAVIGRTSN